MYKRQSGINALQQVVIIIALPFFFMYFVMMYSLVKAMSDDSAAARKTRSRTWEKTDTAEKLEEGENKPAPGYDAQGNEVERPELEYDAEDDSWKFPEGFKLERGERDTIVDERRQD